jgi:hypothetical protein
MTLRKLLLVLPLFFVSTLYLTAQTVTVSATLLNGDGTPAVTNSRLCFSLVDAGGLNPPPGPRVASSGIVVPLGPNCYKPNNSGVVSTPIIANDQIAVQGTTGGATLWFIDAQIGGQTSWSGLYVFKIADVTENLNTKVPVSVGPVVAAPTGDSTYARLDGGNQPFTAGIAVPSINSTAPIYVSTTGDVCTNIINACNNALGPEVYVPGGSYTCSQTNYTFFNQGGIGAPLQPSCRVKGVGYDQGSTNQRTLGKLPTSGTILNFTGPATATGRFDTRGEGTLEFTGINFVGQDAGAGCSPFIFSTNTVLNVHDNYFYGSTFSAITSVATRVQTSGGSGTLKYLADFGVSTNGVHYDVSMNPLKNQGATAVTVSDAFGGSVTVQPGTTVNVRFQSNGDGVTHIQLRLSTAGVGDAMDIIAFIPGINPNGENNSNLFAGTDLTFTTALAHWAAQGGAIITLTQSQSLTQRSCNDGVILGGGGNNVTGLATGAAQGFKSHINRNYFNNTKRAVWLQGNTANQNEIDHNEVMIGSGSDTVGAIEVTAGNFNSITNNEIEMLNYKYGIHLANGSASNTITGNQPIDAKVDTVYGNQGFPGPIAATIQLDTGAASNVVLDTCASSGSTFGVVEGTPGQNKIFSVCGDSGFNFTTKTAGSVASNSVTLLNEQQFQGTLTGSGGDQTIFTYTMPANTMGAGKGIRVKATIVLGAAPVGASTDPVIKLFFGTSSTNSATSVNGSTQSPYLEASIFNNSGVTNAQHSMNITNFASVSPTLNAFGAFNISPSQDTTTALVIKLTFNVSNSQTVQNAEWTVELIQ